MESREHAWDRLPDEPWRDTIARFEGCVRDLGGRLARAYPALSPLLLRGWGTYLYLYVKTVATANSIRHEAPIDPFEVIWIDVDRIEKVLPPRPRSKFKYAGRITGGDWDQEAVRFEDTDVFRAFEAHFERGAEWSETPFFERVVERIERGESMWGCRTRAEFEARCDQLDALYHSIEEHGYMTQAQLAEAGTDDPVEKGHGSAVVRYIYDEMTVSVARDGDLLFNDGRDRLAIAKLLGLESVPVWIMLRHEAWQRVRDDVAAGRVDRERLPERLRTHPDLVGL